MKTLLSFLIPVLVLFSSCKDNSTDSTDVYVNWVGEWVNTVSFDDKPFPAYHGFRISEGNKIAEIGIRHETGKFDSYSHSRYTSFNPKSAIYATVYVNFGDNKGYEATAKFNSTDKSITITFSGGWTSTYYYSEPGKQIQEPVTSFGSLVFNSLEYTSEKVCPSVPFSAFELQDTLNISFASGTNSLWGAYLNLKIPSFTGSGTYSVLKSLGSLMIVEGDMIMTYSIETPNINAITITQNGNQLTGTFQLAMQDGKGLVYEVTDGSFSGPLVKR
ncbi:MAG: hypothetical protein LCH54_08565 [Bacteroidetes bacterium]|nr:hypothetical protein [Bacteroidota bacterium]